MSFASCFCFCPWTPSVDAISRYGMSLGSEWPWRAMTTSQLSGESISYRCQFFFLEEPLAGYSTLGGWVALLNGSLEFLLTLLYLLPHVEMFRTERCCGHLVPAPGLGLFPVGKGCQLLQKLYCVCGRTGLAQKGHAALCCQRGSSRRNGRMGRKAVPECAVES